MSASILLVEDEVLVALMLKKKIEKAGYKVVGPAVNAREAIEFAERTQPDLLLMDVSLPGRIDGIDAAAIIRRNCPSPILFFTGTHRDSSLNERLESIPDVQVFDKLGDFQLVLDAMARAIKMSKE